jgi:hypothetical protein
MGGQPAESVLQVLSLIQDGHDDAEARRHDWMLE